MSTIDERVVEMTFTATNFVQGVQQVVTALTNLKNALNFKDADSSLTDVESTASKFSLAGIGSALDSIASKFSAFGIIGITVLTNIVNKAVDAGVQLVKSLTLDPIIAGFNKYELVMDSTQRIMANTGATLSSVTTQLNVLNQYSNQTVYSFEQMTQAIGQFTSAGIPLNASVATIKGMSNAASLTGASMASLQSAFYQMSQAMAGGVIRLQDWNSLQNAGVADGKEFQQAFEETSDSMGKNVDSMVAKQGGFRNSLQQGWLTSAVFTKAMTVMAGTIDQATGKTVAFSVAQLEAMGYTDAQAVSLNKLSASAIGTATQVRTFSQLMAILKDDVSTSWADVFKAIIGDLPTATKLFTGLDSVLTNLFIAPVNNLADFLTEWAKLGGRAAVLQGFVNLFKALSDIIKPVSVAFGEIFSGNTSEEAVSMSKAFESLTAALIPSKQTIQELTDIFVDLFSAVKIVVDLVGDVISGFTGIGTSVGKAGSGILGILSYLLNYVSALEKVIDGNTKLQSVLSGVGSALALPFKLLGDLPGIFTTLGSVIGAVVTKVDPWLVELGSEFSKLGTAIAQSISSGGFSNVLNVLNEGIFATILLAVKKFISNLGEQSEGGGLISTIKESFEGLTGALQAMQANLKSDILEKIAIAVGLLTVSLVALSLLNVGQLTKSLSAMTVEFTELVAAMAVVTKISGSAGIIKLPIVAASLILLSTAILILSAAVAVLAQFSWDQLAKGLTAIAVLLAELVVTVALLSKNEAGVYSSALAMEAMAVAMNILASAVAKLGALPFDVLAKGVGTIAALLAIILVFNTLSGDGAGLIGTAAAMVIMSAALEILSNVIAKLGSLSWASLAEGLVGITAALIIMAGAMYLMEAGLPGAAAMIVAATAILILGNALVQLSGLGWQGLAIALIALAASLVLIAAALIVMEASLPGAAALIVAAAALAILAPVMVTLGSLSWSELAIGLTALAGTLIILAAAGILLIPALPGMLGLGAAITLIGVGILAAGVGVLAFGTGVVALAAGIAALGVAISAFVASVVGILPTLSTTFAAVIVSFANGIATAGPAIINALTALLTALLNAIIKLTPTLVKAFETILTGMITLLGTDAPKIVSALVTMITNMLNALTSKVPAFTTAATNLIVAMINGISSMLSKIVAAATNLVVSFIAAITASDLKITQAGVEMIINLINGIAKEINTDAPQMRDAGLNLAQAIINGMTGGLLSGLPSLSSVADSLGNSFISSIKSVFGINSPSKVMRDDIMPSITEGFEAGAAIQASAVGAVGTNLGNKAIEGIKTALNSVNDVVSENVNLSPTITPVVDLTQATQGFNQLGNMTKAQLVAASSSSLVASSISADNAAAAQAAGINTATPTSSVQFTQINNSPKALDAATIYRQTKNQLSVVKEALPS
jgi:tape measure domain-containing protein